MKKLYSLLVLLLLLNFCRAQSFQITYAQDTVYGVDIFSTISAVAYVKNVSGSQKIFKVQRTVENLVTGHVNDFCFGPNCNSPGTSVSPNQDTMIASHSDSTFVTHLNPNGIAGTSRVTYKFYNVADNTDTISKIFTFIFTAATSNDRFVTSKNLNEISLAYPNPASSLTHFDYELSVNTKDAYLKVYNFLGTEIRKVELLNRQGTVTIDTDNLTEGVYLYSLVVNGKTTSTRKLLIRK